MRSISIKRLNEKGAIGGERAAHRMNLLGTGIFSFTLARRAGVISSVTWGCPLNTKKIQGSSPEKLRWTKRV